MQLSVVIPALNEADALPGLLDEIAATCDGMGIEWEAIVVDDGSTDGTFEAMRRRAAADRRLGVVKLRRNFGKSDALAAGFARCSGETIVTIDGDGQDDPADIPLLLDELERGNDLVSGWKRDRRDPFSRRAASWVFNRITSRLTGVAMHDMNCGFKAYRAECVRSIDLYGEMHRFIPALAAQQGWRVAEIPVNHRARRFGRSRFGIERYMRGALDLITVLFLGRYQNRPLHLFGGLGFGLTVAGLLICLYLTVLRLGGEAIGDRPLLFLGVLLIVVGAQLLTFGLLGQMLVASARGRGEGPPPAQVQARVGRALRDGDGSERSAREPSGAG